MHPILNITTSSFQNIFKLCGRLNQIFRVAFCWLWVNFGMGVCWLLGWFGKVLGALGRERNTGTTHILVQVTKSNPASSYAHAPQASITLFDRQNSRCQNVCFLFDGCEHVLLFKGLVDHIYHNYVRVHRCLGSLLWKVILPYCFSCLGAFPCFSLSHFLLVSFSVS